MGLGLEVRETLRSQDLRTAVGGLGHLTGQPLAQGLALSRHAGSQGPEETSTRLECWRFEDMSSY
jgi:hypothetical protein